MKKNNTEKTNKIHKIEIKEFFHSEKEKSREKYTFDLIIDWIKIGTKYDYNDFLDLILIHFKIDQERVKIHNNSYTCWDWCCYESWDTFSIDWKVFQEEVSDDNYSDNYQWKKETFLMEVRFNDMLDMYNKILEWFWIKSEVILYDENWEEH